MHEFNKKPTAAQQELTMTLQKTYIGPQKIYKKLTLIGQRLVTQTAQESQRVHAMDQRMSGGSGGRAASQRSVLRAR
jgi:hypothetical protein